MNRRIGIIGDIHGCSDEMYALLDALSREGLSEIFHLGDLVDRGPDSVGVLQLCSERGLRGVRGNHEDALLRSLNRFRRGGMIEAEKHDADLTVALNHQPKLEKYLRDLPYIHVDDPTAAVMVHGGLWPNLALWRQPRAVMYAQLIHPERPGDIRWWQVDREGRTEEENRQEGYRRWWEVNDEPYHVVYGHTVHERPLIYGRTIGIDTGCVYGGALTAVILPEIRFIAVASKRTYVKRERERHG